MNEMRKLMEAVQLNEYLVRQGESIETLLRLNVFGDLGYGDDPELFSDDPDNGISPSQEWLEVLQDYQGEAEERFLQIKSEAKKGRKLTDAEAEAAENTWYDGSDAYQSEEEAVENLPGVYANQLNAVENILHGLIDDDGSGDYAPFGESAVDEDYGSAHVTYNSREATVALHQLMDEGMLNPRVVADAALNYMSEADVQDMADDNSFFGDE